MTVSRSIQLPYRSIAALCVGVVANCIVFTAPLPYIAFMVVDFGVAKNLDSAGYSAGWIAGIFMIGRLVSGIPFGVFADKWGRKICLVISMFNIAALGVVFGLSTNYSTALITRCLCGIGNGFMGVVPTVITELTNNKEHETVAFGYVNAAYGVGFIVGPVLGGLLARPAVQYPQHIATDSVWAAFPYLLPSVCCSLIAVVALVLIVLYVPETLKTQRAADEKQHVVNEEGCDEGSVSIELHSLTHDNSSNSHSHFEVKYGSIPCEDQAETNTLDHITTTATSSMPLSGVEGSTVDLTLSELLSDVHLFLIVVISFLFSLFAVMIKEVFPLWCVSSVARGGLSWSSAQVGIILCCVGIAVVVFQIFLYGPLMALFADRVSPPMILHYQILAAAVPVCVLPLAQYLTVSVFQLSEETTLVVLYMVVVLFYALHNILIVTCYSSLAMIINASVSPNRRCTLNGFTATASSLGNFAAPVIGSTLFALFNSWHTAAAAVVSGRVVFVLCGVLLVWLAQLVKRKLSVYVH